MSRLEKIVRTESMLWGASVAWEYHGVAAQHMDAQWQSILKQFFDRNCFDLRLSADFAAGYGRNTKKLLESGAGHVSMLDVNPDCISHLEAYMDRKKTSALLINGIDLSNIESGSFTFIYSFDAMVHFDPEIVASYIPEFFRTLSPGGKALLHHSNFSDRPGCDFRTNPHWRNYMTKDLFLHFAKRAGFHVVEQRVFSWGDAVDSDCISILERLRD